jgi:hypothetical protein
LETLTDGKVIKYVLDKNIADDKIFCINPYDMDNNNNDTMCFHKDYFDYYISKNNYETLCLKNLGTKKEQTKYQLFHTDIIPISFKHKKKAQKLTLFIKAIKEFEFQDIENLSLKTIDAVFNIRCDEYQEIYEQNNDTYLVLNKPDYIYSLYDLKRGMDYLPVKATVNANKKFSRDDVMYFYVSSDRLAILFALLQGCPCIYIQSDANLLHVYNHKGLIPVEDRMQGGHIIENSNSKSTKSKRKPDYYFGDIFINEVVDENKKDKSYFELFLLNYKKYFNKNEMDCFWYIIFRFLFYLIET